MPEIERRVLDLLEEEGRVRFEGGKTRPRTRARKRKPKDDTSIRLPPLIRSTLGRNQASKVSRSHDDERHLGGKEGCWVRKELQRNTESMGKQQVR